MAGVSSNVRLVRDVLDTVHRGFIARRPDSLPKDERVRVGIVDPTAVGEPRHIPAFVLQQLLHGELAAILIEQVPPVPGVVSPPRHSILRLLAHERLRKEGSATGLPWPHASLSHPTQTEFLSPVVRGP